MQPEKEKFLTQLYGLMKVSDAPADEAIEALLMTTAYAALKAGYPESMMHDLLTRFCREGAVVIGEQQRDQAQRAEGRDGLGSGLS